jgi:hypothetical protein
MLESQQQIVFKAKLHSKRFRTLLVTSFVPVFEFQLLGQAVDKGFPPIASQDKNADFNQ